MGKWTNNDGLTIRYGADEIKPATIGEEEMDGPHRMLELIFDVVKDGNGNKLVVGSQLASETAKLGEGATVEVVDWYVDTAFAGGTGATFGLDLTDESGTVLQALMPATTVTSLTAGASGTSSPAYTVPASTYGFFRVSAGTADVTAGKIRVRVKVSK